MSKSKGNVVDPWTMIEQYGADTIRLYLLASSQVWLPKRFDPRTIPEVAGKFFNALRNSYTFFAGYAGDWTPARVACRGPAPAGGSLAAEPAGRDGGDGDGRRGARYDVTAGVRAIMDFVVDDVSQWYVRVNRARFWAPDTVADPAALATLHEALTTVSRLLAPAAPFVSDWLHRALAGTSVHLARFPVAARARGCRSSRRPWTRCAGWPRWPARRARSATSGCGSRSAGCRWRCPPAVRGPALDQLLELLRLGGERQGDRGRRLRHRPGAAPAQAQLPDSGQALRQAHAGGGRGRGARSPPEQLRGLEQGASATLELDGERSPTCPRMWWSSARSRATGWCRAAARSSPPSIPHLDEALRREGLAREVVNRVQRIRKEAGYVYTDRIALWIDGDAAGARRGAGARRVHPGRDAGAAAGAGGARAGARSGAAGGHRRARSGGGSATTSGRPGRSRPSTHGRVMNKKQLTHLEKRLMEERARVMKELGYYDESFNATLQSSDGDLSSYSFHMADQGTDAMEREKQFLFASQEGRYLWHVNEALRRLYGTPGQVRALPSVRPGDQLRAARRAAARAALHHLQGERGRWQAPLTFAGPGADATAARRGGCSCWRRWRRWCSTWSPS